MQDTKYSTVIFKEQNMVNNIHAFFFIYVNKKLFRKVQVPPETRTPSALLARALTMALWPERFWMKSPLGNFHCLILSGEAEAKVYLQNGL